MAVPGWSDADVLHMLWQWDAQGLSAAQIMVTMGATRSAVLGLMRRVRRAAVDPAGYSDAALLAIVGRVDAGAAADVVAKDFGMTRYAVLGVVHAVRLDLGRAVGCACTCAANRDGGMPADWWRAGLAQRVAA